MTHKLPAATVIRAVAEYLDYEVRHRGGVFYIYKDLGNGTLECIGMMTPTDWMEKLRMWLEE